MTTYNVVRSSDSLSLTAAVNRALREGWHCQGGVATAVIVDASHKYASIAYFQAMIKQTEDS